MYELLGNIAFYSPLINYPEKLIKNPEISSDGASANLALKLPLLKKDFLHLTIAIKKHI